MQMLVAGILLTQLFELVGQILKQLNMMSPDLVMTLHVPKENKSIKHRPVHNLFLYVQMDRTHCIQMK